MKHMSHLVDRTPLTNGRTDLVSCRWNDFWSGRHLIKSTLVRLVRQSSSYFKVPSSYLPCPVVGGGSSVDDCWEDASCWLLLESILKGVEEGWVGWAFAGIGSPSAWLGFLYWVISSTASLDGPIMGLHPPELKDTASYITRNRIKTYWHAMLRPLTSSYQTKNTVRNLPVSSCLV